MDVEVRRWTRGGQEMRRWTRVTGAEIVRGEVERKGLASATQRERCATRTLRPICERQDQEQGCDDEQEELSG